MTRIAPTRRRCNLCGAPEGKAHIDPPRSRPAPWWLVFAALSLAFALALVANHLEGKQ